MPISLMNIDEKNLNKIAAESNNTWKVTHYDQVGRIPHSQEWFHMCKVINATHHKTKAK